MADQWCKIAASLDSHPKIRRAGRLGREVFLFALRRNALPENPVPGRLPAAVMEPWFVADQLMMTEDEAREGLAAAIRTGLLVPAATSSTSSAGQLVQLVIAGWDDGWSKGDSNAGRVAGGKARAASASRKNGRFTPAHQLPPAELDQQKPAHQLRSDQIRLDQRELSRARTIPPSTEPQTQQRAAEDQQADPDPAAPKLPDPEPSTTGRAERLRSSAVDLPMGHDARVERLAAAGWKYAAAECSKAIASGIPGASGGAWGGAPGRSYPPMAQLFARAGEMLTRFGGVEQQAQEAIRRRVDNAVLEARKKNDSQYLGPARMWNAESFAIAVDLDPKAIGARAARTTEQQRYRLPERDDDKPPIPRWHSDPSTGAKP